MNNGKTNLQTHIRSRRIPSVVTSDLDSDHNLHCHMRQACELEQNRNKDLCFVRYCFQPWPEHCFLTNVGSAFKIAGLFPGQSLCGCGTVWHVMHTCIFLYLQPLLRFPPRPAYAGVCPTAFQLPTKLSRRPDWQNQAPRRGRKAQVGLDGGTGSQALAKGGT